MHLIPITNLLNYEIFRRASKKNSCFEGNMLRQIDKDQEGIEMLEKNILVLDEFLKGSSFTKASQLKTEIEPEMIKK